MFNAGKKELEKQVNDLKLKVGFLKGTLEKMLGSNIESIVDLNNLNSDSVDLMEIKIKNSGKHLSKANKDLKNAKAEVRVWKETAEELQTEYDELVEKSLDYVYTKDDVESVTDVFKEEVQELEDEILSLKAINKSKMLEKYYEHLGKNQEAIIEQKDKDIADREKEITRLVKIINDSYDQIRAMVTDKHFETKDVLASMEKVATSVANNSNPKIVLANAEVMTGQE